MKHRKNSENFLVSQELRSNSLGCEKCGKKPISTKPSLCSEHFDAYVLDLVKKTIADYDLFSKNEKICVAVSGGKDSLALLDVLTRLGYEVEGLFINEGIANYREFSEDDLDLFSKLHNLKVRKVTFKGEAGFSMDEVMGTKKYHACTVCGTLRRHLLNKYSQDYDVLATGHNLDDEAQTVLINLARGNTNLFLRTGPKTNKLQGFTTRVKPFYFLSEKHVLTYTLLRKIKTEYSECPYAPDAYRAYLTDYLNIYEDAHPGAKRRILEQYLLLKSKLKPRKQVDDEEAIEGHHDAGEIESISSSKAHALMKEINNVLS